MKAINDSHVETSIQVYLMPCNGHKPVECIWKPVRIKMICDHLDKESHVVDKRFKDRNISRINRIVGCYLAVDRRIVCVYQTPQISRTT